MSEPSPAKPASDGYAAAEKKMSSQDSSMPRSLPMLSVYSVGVGAGCRTFSWMAG